MTHTKRMALAATGASLLLASCASLHTPRNASDSLYAAQLSSAGTGAPIAACTTAPVPQQVADLQFRRPAALSDSGDRLADGDRLRLSVIGDTDQLSGGYIISAMGDLAMPGGVRIHAAGKTLDQVDHDLGECAWGKPFSMWKFRSMVVDAERRATDLHAHSERVGFCFKMKNDPRITPIGRWIRRLSINELPQLINVLRGDMSIVGPRPPIPSEVVRYDPRARERLHGKPGLTCTWQVSGRADISFERQVDMDIAYLQKPSIPRDAKLIAMTIPALLLARGAY